MIQTLSTLQLTLFLVYLSSTPTATTSSSTATFKSTPSLPRPLHTYPLLPDTCPTSPLPTHQCRTSTFPLPSSRLVLATRFYATAAQSDSSLAKLEAFIQRAIQLNIHAIIIAVRVEVDRSDAVAVVRGWAARRRFDVDLHVLPVQPWGHVIPALNSLLYAALEIGATFIIFQSVEVHMKAWHVSHLVRQVSQPDVLVAGAALVGSHVLHLDNVHCEPHPTDPRCALRNASSPLGTRAQVEATGLTSPWNTASVWHAASLGRTGFLAVSEGMGAATRSYMAMIEEPTLLSFVQHLPVSMRGRHRAKLLVFPEPPVWHVRFSDSARQRYQSWKLETRAARHRLQLDALGIREHGVVEHIYING